MQVLENVWILKARFPEDARLDYKLVVDGQIILDPLNPNQQWSGFGPNSELRMPGWRQESYTEKDENIPAGVLTDTKIRSEKLNREVSYSTYHPHKFDRSKDYPILYFTDGPEYMDERLGTASIIMDNLIAAGKIPPVIAVFVDPRDPDNHQINHRVSEYAMNEAFIDFFISELIPAVEDSLQLLNGKRAIIGTSMGGLNAAYFGGMKPEEFPLIGVQSPAFWYKEDIYELFRGTDPNLSIRIYMSTGVINDTEEGARKMHSILKEKRYPTLYKEVNEGHSWGNWKNLIDEMLIFLLAGAAN